MRPVIAAALLLAGTPTLAAADAGDRQRRPKTEQTRVEPDRGGKTDERRERPEHSASYAGTPSSFRIGANARETQRFFDWISSMGE